MTSTQTQEALAAYHASDKIWREINISLIGASNPYPAREKKAFKHREALLKRYLYLKEADLSNQKALDTLISAKYRKPL